MTKTQDNQPRSDRYYKYADCDRVIELFKQGILTKKVQTNDL